MIYNKNKYLENGFELLHGRFIYNKNNSNINTLYIVVRQDIGLKDILI
jgi:hypothetical protein